MKNFCKNKAYLSNPKITIVQKRERPQIRDLAMSSQTCENFTLPSLRKSIIQKIFTRGSWRSPWIKRPHSFEVIDVLKAS